MSPISRRSLLRAGAILPLGVAACADDETPDTPPGPDAGTDVGADTSDATSDTSDATSDTGDATSDTGGPDAATPSDASADTAPDTETPDAETDPADTTDPDAGDVDETPDPFIKGPWVQVAAGGAVRLLAESGFGEPVEVTLTPDDGESSTHTTTSESAEITFFWPRLPLRGVDYPDEAGTVWRHEVTFDDLTPGARYTWSIERDGVTREGRFRAPPATGDAFRMIWIADTMAPLGAQVVEKLAEHEPDLVVHGGDIQYQSNPLDSWNGFFRYFQPLFAQAPVHFTIGNHEYEDYDEYDEIWVRLMGDQGDAQHADTAHAFTWAGVRFLILNSEREFGVEGSQMEWLRAQLEAASADPDIRTIIPCFHRPTYSFSRYRPVLERRELTDALFRAHGVKLVFMGHCHCYERFENEGITYLLDGGGGASSYNPDHNLFFYEQERPSDLPLRVTSQTGQGGLVLEFGADGSVEGRRIGITGDEQDRFTIPAG